MSAITIPERELEEHFIHASGPGGQNVNKVATAVQLRFDVARSASLPEPVRQRLMRLAAGRINSRGVLIIEAKSYRSRERNRQEARRRLFQLIERAARKPKRRIATRPSSAAKRRRLETKRRRSLLKKQRDRRRISDE